MSIQVNGAAPQAFRIAVLAALAGAGAGCGQLPYAPVQVTEPAPPLRQGGGEESLSLERRRGTALEAKEAAQEAARSEAAVGESEDGGPDENVPGNSLSDMALVKEGGEVLDDWHAAASAGDRDRYIDHFTKDAVFLGTDESERWDLATFTAYVDEHFRPGSGWSYAPFDRHVMLSSTRDMAWFDERLNSSGYGALRGTGVLRREGDAWKIAHYSMTFTIPIDVAREVIGVVREASRR